MNFLNKLNKKNINEIYESLFRFIMVWRIIYSLFKIILGIILFKFIGTPISHLFYKIMGHKLMGDQFDFLIQIINPFMYHVSYKITYFLVIYLIFWAIIDIVLSIILLKHKLWAFPISILLMSVFVLYEIFRFTNTQSLILLWVIIMDIVLIWVIKGEYNKLKNKSIFKN